MFRARPVALLRPRIGIRLPIHRVRGLATVAEGSRYETILTPSPAVGGIGSIGTID